MARRSTRDPTEHHNIEATVTSGIVHISSGGTRVRKRKSPEDRRYEGPDEKTRESSGVRVSPRSSNKEKAPSARNKDKGKGVIVNERTRGRKQSSGEGMKVSSVIRTKKKGKKCRVQEENSDNDFETRKKEVGEGSCVRNKPGKQKNIEKKVKPPRISYFISVEQKVFAFV
ncbi:hypothetical protein L6452_02625 [Arctium lappa]|uniref:Uncharacterized protein n=1 Tax=Arctium lappa TaxID=4217 RepID=A0ACB9FKX8_ARCLA|nr:hypothetical protein L6452_02625 [Arctium lappa]